MNKEHVKGAIDNVVGKNKEVVGHAIGNKKLEVEGELDQTKGAVHDATGDVKHAGREAVDHISRTTDKY